MDMQGNRQLAVTQQQAWDALNDPEVLKTCIPGCDKVEATGENQYAIGMALKIGPVSAKFTGKITLSDIKPPSSYKHRSKGRAASAGFGKGNAQVTLTPQSTARLRARLHRACAGRRQDRATGPAPDRRRGQIDGRRFLQALRRGDAAPLPGRLCCRKR